MVDQGGAAHPAHAHADRRVLPGGRAGPRRQLRQDPLPHARSPRRGSSPSWSFDAAAREAGSPAPDPCACWSFTGPTSICWARRDPVGLRHHDARRDRRRVRCTRGKPRGAAVDALQSNLEGEIVDCNPGRTRRATTPSSSIPAATPTPAWRSVTPWTRAACRLWRSTCRTSTPARHSVTPRSPRRAEHRTDQRIRRTKLLSGPGRCPRACGSVAAQMSSAEARKRQQGAQRHEQACHRPSGASTKRASRGRAPSSPAPMIDCSTGSGAGDAETVAVVSRARRYRRDATL